MSRTKLVVLLATGLIIILVFAVWVGVQVNSARAAAKDFLETLAEGKVPLDTGDTVQLLAENLLEYGMPAYSVGRVRLTPSFSARAEIVLEDGSEQAGFLLTLKRIRGGWQPVATAESALAIGIYQGLPRLELSIGEAALSKELQALGVDKLLTVQTGRTEWLHQGWLDNKPYFSSLVEGQPSELLIGQSDIELYDHNGGLAAALAEAAFVPELIRVNISTTGFEGIFHSVVGIESVAPWQVTEATTGRVLGLDPGAVSVMPGEDSLVLTSAQGEYTFAKRIIFSPQQTGDKLTVASITRSGGQPAYYGSLEVANFSGDLVIVNELSLEKYLRYVLPSEMPASFGETALEVQAIVARTYALRNLLSSAWRSTSAHVVDSVLSQVYNNGPGNSAATAAVQTTQGEIVAYNGVPADVRYFSTSSGYTANAHEVWPDSQGNFPGNPTPWLSSQPQFPGVLDISTEEEYAAFILSPPVGAYDARSAWFRWHVSVPIAQLEDNIRQGLKSIHKSNPSSVLLLDSAGDYKLVETLPDELLEELVDLVPAQRGAGGVLMAVDIIGNNGTWRVQREYNIRKLLKPTGSIQHPVTLFLHTGGRQTNFSLLPSAYVFWELDSGQITFHGGGFGHGVGMSQYGVRELAQLGWTREQIIQHYFPGTEVIDISE